MNSVRLWQAPLAALYYIVVLSALIGLMFLESGQMAADFLEGMCVSHLLGQQLGLLEPVYSLLPLAQLEGTASCP
jgi:hypothetical protein